MKIQPLVISVGCVALLAAAAVACSPAAQTPQSDGAAPAAQQPATEIPQAVQPTSTSPPVEPASSPPDDLSGWVPVEGFYREIPLVFVPAGCFVMGSTEEQIEQAFQASSKAYSGAPFPPPERALYEAEGPAHAQCLEAYWIGKTEVTNRQYALCVEEGVCRPPADLTAFNDPAFADYPVVDVTWGDARAYAGWLGGSLPSEAQWEYAARGSQGYVYPWGDTFGGFLNFCDLNCEVYFLTNAEYDDGYALAAPVGTYPGGASWVGALDMSGNAREWTSSLAWPYPYDAKDGREDPGGEGMRAQRGGDFNQSHIQGRGANRFEAAPEELCAGIYGFRVLISTAVLPAPGG